MGINVRRPGARRSKKRKFPENYGISI